MVSLNRNRFVLLLSCFFISIYCSDDMDNSGYLIENFNHKEDEFPTSYFAENELATFSQNTISEQVGKVTEEIMLLLS